MPLVVNAAVVIFTISNDRPLSIHDHRQKDTREANLHDVFDRK